MKPETLLHIETATTVCSVALSVDGNIISVRDTDAHNSHSVILTTFIEEVIKEAGIRNTEIDAVAVSSGPGSYTGLRIGVATAKGLCYSLDRPLIAVPTLKAMAFGIWHLAFSIQHLAFGNEQIQQSEGRAASSEVLLCPMLDARRMEVYCAIFDDHFNEIMETKAEIIDQNSFSELLASRKVIFAGDGAAKCKSVLENHPTALFLNDFVVSASHMVRFAEERFRKGEFEDLAYFEPFYLKDFIAGKPKVKGLH